MSNSIPASTLEKFTTFGDLLRFLRRRAGLTQLELSIAVGYSDPHISRLEQNMRLPDIPTIQARFISPLCLEDEPQAVARLLELATEVKREDAPASGLCPYKGLDYFDEVDADLFVGREALTEKLANEVLALASNEQANQGKFFAVVGASGSGKSSLVRAGLVPALRWNKTCANWSIHIITPSTHPLESLATTLANGSSLAATAGLMDDLAGDHRALSLYIKQVLKVNPGSYLLLVIDQFEELFTLCRSEAERLAYIDNLLTAAFDVDVKSIVVLTLRADFYAHCASYPHLRQALAKQQEYIGAMKDEEMLRAIEEPARRGHWEFEPGLVDLILHDVGHEPGALPLLSHALLETWQRRHGRTITFSGYASSGGVRGAIAETAETVFTDQFNHEQQAIARRIFLRLTELGDETATGDTRRRATFSELIRKPDETDATQAVLKALADARLVTTSEDSVQVAHEALIREWPTLRSWLEDNREGLRLHRQLTEAALEWLAAERETDLLFRGARLVQVRYWADAHADDLNAQEREFLAACIASSEQEAAEREAAHQRELETAQKLADTEKLRAEEGVKSSQRLRRRAILASIFGVIALILAVFAIFAWQRSYSQASVTRSLSLAAASEKLNTAGQGDLALLLAIEAIKSDDSRLEALNALRTVATGFGRREILNGHSQAVRTVAISPDAKTALSGSCARLEAGGSCSAGELILWDLDAQKELQRWPAHAGWVNKVAFSLNGQTLISGGEDGSLNLWNLNGKLVGELPRQSSAITSLVVVPRRGDILSGTADGTMSLWDLKTGELLQSYAGITSPITALAAARDTLTAVSAHQDGSLMVWNLNSKTPNQQFLLQGKGISAVAITPDGSRIIYSNSAVPDLFIRMVDAKTGRKLAEQLTGCIPGDVVLSPDLSYFLATCSNGIFQQDLQSWNILGTSLDPPGIQSALAISQDGRLSISASLDGTISVWNMGQLDSETITINVDALNAIAISPDGKYLLLSDASRNGSEQPALWDIAGRKIIRTYLGFEATVSSGAAAISPDNRFIAVAGLVSETGAPRVMVWEKDSGDLICQGEGLTENGRALAFSPDSQSLLVGSQVPNGKAGRLILYETRTCNIVREFDTQEEVSSVRINANGTRALTGSSLLGRAILWDMATGKEIRRFSSPNSNTILTAVFGPGETTILGSGISELYLWDLQTGNLQRRFTGNPAIPWMVAISPDGRYVLSGNINGDVVLWDFATGEMLNQKNLKSVVFSLAFNPDSKTAYAASTDGKLLEWHIAEKSLPDLLDWIKSNRYLRQLTAQEKAQYLLEP